MAIQNYKMAIREVIVVTGFITDEVTTISDDWAEVAQFAKSMEVESADVFSAKKNLRNG